MQPAATRSIESSPLYNQDLAPTDPARRRWGTYNFAALWVSMAHCIPTYMLASGLIGSGMSWKQALLTILLGNTIVLVPILLNSHAGTKYGIPFPVFARAAYGTRGSNLPALMRALVACGWFGIQAWIGGQALHVFFRSLWAGWPLAIPGNLGGHTPTEWIAFLIFWALNILVIYRGMDLLRKVENWAAPFVLIMTSLLVWWALGQAHGLGPILAQKGKYATWHEFWPVFVPSLTAMIGFWATLSLNMPDFTRFGRSQREQAVGQVIALPTTMTVFAAMGVIITSASAIIYGKAIWDPVELVGRFTEPWIVAVSMFTVVVATLSVNIAANVVSPANDFANAFPRFITFRRGGLLTGLIGIVMQPWKLLADPSGYIFKWLLGYSGGLGSIAGVLIADYWIVRRRRLDLDDLYLEDGVYGGWSWRGIVATLLGCAAAWIGLVVPSLHVLYDYSWFVGFGVAFGVYWLAGVGNKRRAAFLSPMRPVFHWKYSGVVIPVFFGTGVAMALASKFSMAYVFFVLFGLWSLGYWLTSDWLQKKRTSLSSRAIRRDATRFAVEGRKYCAWERGVCVLIIGVAGGFMFWTFSTKQQFERDDVYQHLTANHFIPLGSEDDPIDTMFTVANGGSYQISKTHGITCLTNLAVGNAGTSPVRNMASWVVGGQMAFSGAVHTFDLPPASAPLLPGGDAQTDRCLKFWAFANGTDCSDVTLIFWYSLENQPDIHQEKRFRYVAYKGKTGKFSWYIEPVSSPATYCEGYIKRRPAP